MAVLIIRIDYHNQNIRKELERDLEKKRKQQSFFLFKEKQPIYL
jgi:hypothetical protein